MIGKISAIFVAFLWVFAQAAEGESDKSAQQKSLNSHLGKGMNIILSLEEQVLLEKFSQDVEKNNIPKKHDNKKLNSR